MQILYRKEPFPSRYFIPAKELQKNPFLNGHQFILDNRIGFNVICLPHLKIPFWKEDSKSDEVQRTCINYKRRYML